MSEPAKSSSRPAGRARRPEVDEAVVCATVELLAKVSFSGLSIEQVARRARVGKPAIYRRWRSKAALVVDVLVQVAPPVEIPADANMRERLRTIIVGTHRKTAESSVVRVLMSVVGEALADPELGTLLRKRYFEPRRAVVHEVLCGGVASGALRTDLDVGLMYHMLAGPLLNSWVVDGEPIDEGQANRVFDEIWATISAGEAHV